jgi:hypothetical protein
MVNNAHEPPIPYVYEVTLGERLRHLVSPLAPDEVFEHGLDTEAVYGLLALGVPGLDGMPPDHFQENPAFVRFLHETIADDAGGSVAIRAAAGVLRAGRLPVPDERAPGESFGSIEVRNGEPVPMTYEPNPDHRLYTTDGFFRLPEELALGLRRRMVERMHELGS